MNLLELQGEVNRIITKAVEYEVAPHTIAVSIQIEHSEETCWSTDLELHYDNDGEVSGVVIVGENGQDDWDDWED